MPNEQNIQSYKLGKFNIDVTPLSNEDKIKWLKTDNLLKDLIKFYDKTNKLMINFNKEFRGEQSE